MINADPISTRGKILILNDTFFTKNELFTIDPEPLVIALARKNHGIIPLMSHNTNGVSFADGPALKPTLKTNQITSINNSGCKNAQARPR